MNTPVLTGTRKHLQRMCTIMLMLFPHTASTPLSAPHALTDWTLTTGALTCAGGLLAAAGPGAGLPGCTSARMAACSQQHVRSAKNFFADNKIFMH